MTTGPRLAPRWYAGIIEALRRHRLMTSLVTAGYLFAYLWSLGDIVVTAADRRRLGALPAIQVAADWPAKLLRQTAPFSYEPILAARLTGHVQLFVAPVNVALGLLLGGLAGANLAAASHLYRTATTCRRRSFAGLLGMLPGLLTGFACCAPTLTLFLGAQIAAALIGLRDWLFPLSLAILLAGLAWSANRLARRGPPAHPETPLEAGADALAGAYALDALAGRDRARFDRHLASCPTCALEQRELREATAGLAAAVAADPPADLIERAVARAEQARQLPPPAGKPEPVPSPMRNTVRRMPPRSSRRPG